MADCWEGLRLVCASILQASSAAATVELFLLPLTKASAVVEPRPVGFIHGEVNLAGELGVNPSPQPHTQDRNPRDQNSLKSFLDHLDQTLVVGGLSRRFFSMSGVISVVPHPLTLHRHFVAARNLLCSSF